MGLTKTQSLTSKYQFLSKYSRWREQDQRRETYFEAVKRAMLFIDKATGYRMGNDTYYGLMLAMEHMEAFPSLRLFQMAGPAAERCNVSIYNCAYRAIDSLGAFSEILYVLMQGTGCGFSVEKQYVDRLPSVVRKQKYGGLRWQVQDTTEGWCEALGLGLRRWTAGLETTFDFSRVRPAGVRLKTKGGWASGPDSLRQLLDFARGIISRHWGSGGRLSPLDCHDIVCKIGEIVVVGGVRRSALLSLSDLNDTELRDCKQGRFWENTPWRSMTNNSAVYIEKPTRHEFTQEWQSLRESGTGERGIWNRGGYTALRPARRSDAQWGVNPCGEIALRNQGLCNLSRAIARADDTRESLAEKVKAATIFGTLQSCLTKFGYLPVGWTRNADEERLLGVTIDGAMDCPLLRPGAVDRDRLLVRLRELAVETNREWAGKLGIPASAAVTTMQPGGNGPQLFGCSSGLHRRYAPFYIRRFRASRHDPLTQLMIDSGTPWNPEIGEERESCKQVVFDFPVQSPAGALTKGDDTALGQFENWLAFKQHWTEHNPSVTIYVKDEEWEELGDAVYRNWDYVGGLSFLPADGGIYQLAPYEEIDAAEFQARMAKMPDVDFSLLPEYERVDETNFVGEVSCVAGACEL
jgi:ribonucleoside-triphosphate reductase